MSGLLGLLAVAAVGLGGTTSHAGPLGAPPVVWGFAPAVFLVGASFAPPPCGEYFVRFEGTVSRRGWTTQIVRSADGDWVKFVKTVDTRVSGARTAWGDIAVGDRVTVCYRAYETSHTAGAFRRPDRRASRVYVTDLAP